MANIFILEGRTIGGERVRRIIVVAGMIIGRGEERGRRSRRDRIGVSLTL